MSDLTIGGFVALDPAAGIKSRVGIAYYAGGYLAACAGVKTGASADESHGGRCMQVAETLLKWCLTVPHFAPRAVVLEWPQIYSDGPGDPNDLPPLAGVAMAFAGALAAYAGAAGQRLRVISYLPREWTYGLPKSKKGSPWNSARGNLIRLALRPSELELCRKADHDCLDGIGIGLHALNRLRPARVIPR